MTDLRAARESLGWSQARLAARLGVSQSELSKMESGDKPLNNQALAFVSMELTVKTPPGCTGDEKSGRGRKIGINKPTKLNRLQTANLKKMPTPGCRVETWEKWWFSAVNPVCVPCVRTCKQSAMVRVIACPARKVLDKEERSRVIV